MVVRREGGKPKSPELVAVNGNITNPSPLAQKTAERKEERVENSPVVTAELLLSPEVVPASEEWSSGWTRAATIRVNLRFGVFARRNSEGG